MPRIEVMSETASCQGRHTSKAVSVVDVVSVRPWTQVHPPAATGGLTRVVRQPQEEAGSMRFPRLVRRNPIVEVAIDYGQVWETMDVCPPP